MATYDWPLELGAPKSLDFQLVQTTVHARSMFGYHGQTVDLLNERWTTKLDIDIRDAATGAKYEAFLASLRKGTHSVRLPRFDRLVPAGTLQTSAGVVTTAAQGAKSVTIFAPYGSTLLMGDLIEIDNQLFEVAEDCAADVHGKIVIPLVNKVKRSFSGVTRASTATEMSGLGVLSTVPADVLRTSYGTGKNLYYGENLLEADTGSYGVWGATLKDGTNNPRGLKPGDTLTLSATLWCDALAGQDNATSTLYLWTANSVGGWTNSAQISASNLTGGFKSASVTLGVEADIHSIAVGLYHQGGTTNYAGRVSAKDIQVERGASATAFESGRTPLLEPEATNLYLHSNDFSQVNWAKSNTTITVDSVTLGPNNAAGCYKLAESNTSEVPHFIGQSFVSEEDTDYTYSVILKPAERTSCYIETVNKNNVNAAHQFNLATGQVASPGGQPLATFTRLLNGWVRLSVTRNSGTGVASTNRFNLFVTQSFGGTAVYAGTVGSGLLLWGASVEQGSSATSHIVTTTAPVTRAADVINTPVNLQSPAIPFKLKSKGAVTYGTGGVMQAMELAFEEAPL